MIDQYLKINPLEEREKIIKFIKGVFKKQQFSKAVIGLSGGVDSTTSLYLLTKAIPAKNIIVAHLYYYQPKMTEVNRVLKRLKIPKKNIYIKSIKDIVDKIVSFDLYKGLDCNDKFLNDQKIRLGNIMARVRMMILYDLAKKHHALVCGSENKSEYLLGYFTRFGDQASDFEPIRHLYKTQVYKLAKYIGLPKKIINIQPTAALWPGQTDEGDFGFSYKEADKVLYLYFDKHLPAEQIVKKGYRNAKKIIKRYQNNRFKRLVPYTIKEDFQFL